jgi:hypothetical protein
VQQDGKTSSRVQVLSCPVLECNLQASFISSKDQEAGDTGKGRFGAYANTVFSQPVYLAPQNVTFSGSRDFADLNNRIIRLVSRKERSGRLVSSGT